MKEPFCSQDFLNSKHNLDFIHAKAQDTTKTAAIVILRWYGSAGDG